MLYFGVIYISERLEWRVGCKVSMPVVQVNRCPTIDIERSLVFSK